MKLQYKRTHVPTGKNDILDFNDTQLIPHHGVFINGIPHKLWVGEAECLIYSWNKMGVVDGIQLWRYELVVNNGQ